MKIALVQQNYHIGNFEYNTEKIIQGIRQAKEAGADLAVFSELSVCGYPPRDFLEFQDFLAVVMLPSKKLKNIVPVSGDRRLSCAQPDPKGKDLFNAAWFLHDQELKGQVYKTCLPTYDIFDEYRYFEPGSGGR